MFRSKVRFIVLTFSVSFAIFINPPIVHSADNNPKAKPKKPQTVSTKKIAPPRKSKSVKRKVSNTGEVHVIQMDADVPVDSLSSDGVTVHPITQPQPQGMIPTREVRDQIFFKAGLYKEVAQWDELAKDMFFMKSEYKSLQDLIKSYPQFDPEKLQKLKILIQEFRQWEQ